MNCEIAHVYRNKKTQTLYIVDNIARAAWDAQQHIVVYHPVGVNEYWVRSYNEFMEKFDETNIE
jgi:hypothetical protein